MRPYDDMTTPKILQDAIDAQEERIVSLRAIRDAVVASEQAVAAVGDKYSGQINMWISTYDDPAVHLTIPVERMADSVHMLTALSSRGFDRKGDGKVNEYAGSREFKFDGGILVSFTPPTNSDGLRPGCRREIVGYDRMPRYKIVCDDGSSASREAAAESVGN